MKSIIPQDNDRCFICGRSGVQLQTHHCWHGTANRAIADKYGLTVKLCLYCHTGGPKAVHNCSATDKKLMALSQRRAMEFYGWDLDEWRRHFDKSIL